MDSDQKDKLDTWISKIEEQRKFENLIKAGDKDEIIFALKIIINKYRMFSESITRAEFSEKQFYYILKLFGETLEQDGSSISEGCKNRILDPSLPLSVS